MNNLKNIYLKDIKDNIYFLENYKIQILIDDIYIDLYDKNILTLNNVDFLNDIFIFSNYSKNKTLNNLLLNNVDEDIDESKKYLIYNTYEEDFKFGLKRDFNKTNLTNYILNTITYYIFKYKTEKIQNEYVKILKNNIISSKIKRIDYIEKRNWIDKLYFSENLFEDIYNNLDLNIKIIFCNYNSFDKIMDTGIDYGFGNDYSIYYKLINDKYLKLEYDYIDEKQIDIVKSYDLLDNKFNLIQQKNYDLIYKEILIIDCNYKFITLNSEKIDINLTITELREELEKKTIELKRKTNDFLIEKKINENFEKLLQEKEDLLVKKDLVLEQYEYDIDEFKRKLEKAEQKIKELEKN